MPEFIGWDHDSSMGALPPTNAAAPLSPRAGEAAAGVLPPDGATRRAVGCEARHLFPFAGAGQREAGGQSRRLLLFVFMPASSLFFGRNRQSIGVKSFDGRP